MSKNVVIVESPAKAKTIEKFLGKDYVVKSSFGHIRDLVKKNYGIDLENNYEPQYEVMPDKKKIVAELKKEVQGADSVLLASDEDREGEAIAWHLFEVLKLKNKTTKRIVFNEITKEAILKAVANPGTINLDLVNAQQARRVLDRLVGFELSSVLWKKVKSSLSAGRVQSVAVRLLVDREREIMNFVPEASFRITSDFIVSDNNKILPAVLNARFTEEADVNKFFETCGKLQFSVASVETKPSKRTPAPPFTTSSLQQEAGRKLGFPVAKTMRVAQTLYESGHITYMRTDSVNLSQTSLDATKQAVLNDYGDKYYKLRTYKTKSKGAQEAHEAIRPTYIQNETVDGTYDEVRLYELIRKRTMACQMSDALFEKTNIDITAQSCKHKFEANGEVLIFDGFIRAYQVEDDSKDTENQILPKVKQGEVLGVKKMDAVQKYTKHAARYTEATLVRQMEELGIGRPSTYAPTISTIQNRGYVVKEDRTGTERNYIHIEFKGGTIARKVKSETVGTEKGKLFPTEIAMVVTDFLSENFKDILDYNFTADVETRFDEIASGKIVWQKMIDKFYKDFQKQVSKTVEEADRNDGERILGIDPVSGKNVSARLARFGPVVQLGEKTETEKPQYANLAKGQHLETITLEEALELLNTSGEGRFIGVHPESGKNIYARMARFGAVVQLGDSVPETKAKPKTRSKSKTKVEETPEPEVEKPVYASLLKTMSIETLTLEQALDLLRLPRTLGAYEGKTVTVADGRFGPYVKHDGKFASLKKTDNPMTINLERAIELLIEKAKKDVDKLIKTFPNDADMKIMKDRWGKPCIFHKKSYFRIAKGDPESMTYEDCVKIVEAETKPKTKKK